MWKSNWSETKRHFVDWWNRDGIALRIHGCRTPDECPHEDVGLPSEPESTREAYTDYKLRAERNHYALSLQMSPADTLPISATDIGPGSLALWCGCEPKFSKSTVWFNPCIHECSNPEKLPPIKFDESSRWWKLTEATLKACADRASGRYMVGCPDLVENIDILAAMRDPSILLMDMIERPQWVEQKTREINEVWFESYQRIYDIIKLDDGSSAFGAFCLWGPGKTAKVQCDTSAMFSPEMFSRFVVPSLAEQCEWLDFSMYHLDGTQAMCHLDALLEIEALDAIEWTPQAGIERGGHSRWFDMYNRILEAGKSVQIVGVKKEDILPILESLGAKGVYIMTSASDTAEAEDIISMVDKYR